jgi:hypothetical protein
VRMCGMAQSLVVWAIRKGRQATHAVVAAVMMRGGWTNSPPRGHGTLDQEGLSRVADIPKVPRSVFCNLDKVARGKRVTILPIPRQNLACDSSKNKAN